MTLIVYVYVLDPRSGQASSTTCTVKEFTPTSSAVGVQQNSAEGLFPPVCTNVPSGIAPFQSIVMDWGSIGSINSASKVSISKQTGTSIQTSSSKGPVDPVSSAVPSIPDAMGKVFVQLITVNCISRTTSPIFTPSRYSSTNTHKTPT